MEEVMVNEAEVYESPYLLDVQEISGRGFCVTGGSGDSDDDDEIGEA